VKNDFEILASTSKTIALYLLFTISFKGGQELAHSGLNWEFSVRLLLSILLTTKVPLYTFFMLMKKLSKENAGAKAATYSSVSVVTFACLFIGW